MRDLYSLSSSCHIFMNIQMLHFAIIKTNLMQFVRSAQHPLKIEWANMRCNHSRALHSFLISFMFKRRDQSIIMTNILIISAFINIVIIIIVLNAVAAWSYHHFLTKRELWSSWCILSVPCVSNTFCFLLFYYNAKLKTYTALSE